MSNSSFDEQAAQLVKFVSNIGTSGTRKQLAELLRLSSTIPTQFFPQDFPDKLAVAFTADPEEIRPLFTSPNGGVQMPNFDPLVPPTGWLHDYIEYTRETEPPTVYHFFAAVTVLGSNIGRRICFPRGSGDIFPNVCCVLVAPPGKCKKTTACNLAVNLFRRVGGNVLADKITPEALVEAFKTSTTATGLIYAPEWAVFLGRQQYMEGLVPMLTALFDCPETWTSATIMRSTTQLQKVAISHLAASTIDWMQTSMTRDMFNGGFMSRLLFIVQHDSPRKFPFPPALNKTLEKRLLDGLLQMQNVVGQVAFSPEAKAWYEKWYMNRKSSPLEKQFAGYLERKPDRLIQLAMVLNASENPKSLEIQLAHLRMSEAILGWIEKMLPSAFSELASSQSGDDQSKLMKQIRHHGGELNHSEWMRMNRSRLSADQFKKAVDTLKQSNMVTQDPVTKRYYLLPAGWTEE